MRKSSIIVEFLRSQPRLLFWVATLAQAALWFLVPALFYASPPGELPYTLAIGHEYQLGTYLGPPLAYWLSELTFALAGGSVVGIYLLAQICVVVTYWAVFALGRAIVGPQHAVIATLLMVGIATFGLPTPDFGPAVVAMALTALMVLHLWRAIGERVRKAWFFLAVEMGLLLLTSYSGLIAVVLAVVFIAVTERGRATLDRAEPWMAGIVLAMVLFPHLIWLDVGGETIGLTMRGLQGTEAGDGHLSGWIRLVGGLLLTHAGLAVLLVLASAWRAKPTGDFAVFPRRPVDPFARRFLYYFALAPGILATLVAGVLGLREPVGGTAPYVVLSGLAVVLVAGDAIAFHRQRMVAGAWGMLLALPPVGTLAAILALPWVIAVDFTVVHPAAAMGRFFSENFERRTGQRLAIVAGDPHTAALVALGAPSRPSLFLDANPQYSPWLTAQEVKNRGAVVVWPTSDTAGAPPEQIKRDFPDLVPEVPRAFERMVQGRLPLLRIGWGVVRPQGAAAPAR